MFSNWSRTNSFIIISNFVVTEKFRSISADPVLSESIELHTSLAISFLSEC